MKKKRLKAFMIVFPTVLILLACGCPGKSDKEPELTPEEIAEKYKDVPLDPYGCYIDDADWISEYKGFYLVRDNIFYSLNNFTSLKERPEYKVGEINDYNGTQKIFKGEMGSIDNHPIDYYYSLGDFELLTYEEGDEIRSYGVSNVDLYKLEDHKYGIERTMAGEGYDNHQGYIETTEGRKNIPSNCKEFKYQIGDEVIDCSYDLDKGTNVTVSWFKGTDYYEYTAVANSRFWIYPDSLNNPTYKLEGELIKDGYAKYDLSSVEAGTYLVLSHELTTVDWSSTKSALTGGGIIVIE